jgi:hypothetical protein
VLYPFFGIGRAEGTYSFYANVISNAVAARRRQPTNKCAIDALLRHLAHVHPETLAAPEGVQHLNSARDTGPVPQSEASTEQFHQAQCAFLNRRIPECLSLLASAEALGQNPDECDACRWTCWMLLGRFDKAWKTSNRILARQRRDPHCLWDGLPFDGKRVIVRCLHGFGDAIQFVRYARLLKRMAAAVTVQVHPQLLALFRSMPFLDRVVTWDEYDLNERTEGDQQIEVMELPRAFRTTLATIPGQTPYLWADSRYGESRRQALDDGRKARVGLLWEGGDWDAARNIPLGTLWPILERSDVEFYSFQRGRGREELASLECGRRIRDLSGDSPEIAHFAADLTHMDLLITVDTMAAHLAGALGKPVWVLLPFHADWRWMLNRCDSPWYSTMRLFRQRVPGGWNAPVAEVTAELKTFAAAFDSRLRAVRL